MLRGVFDLCVVSEGRAHARTGWVEVPDSLSPLWKVFDVLPALQESIGRERAELLAIRRLCPPVSTNDPSVTSSPLTSL
jgi:hypothetical protein